ASAGRAQSVSRRGLLGRGRAVIALAALYLLQDNPVEEHGQLGSADLHARWTVAGRHGEAKDTGFQALIPQTPAVFFPGQDLEPVPRAVTEDEPVPGEGIIAEGLPDEGAEAIERFAEAGGLGAEEDADAGREAQHAGSSSAVKRARRAVGSKPGGMRMQRPLDRTTSSDGPESRPQCWTWTGRKVTGSGAWGAHARRLRCW